MIQLVKQPDRTFYKQGREYSAMCIGLCIALCLLCLPPIGAP